jgi:predicted phosphodiesterase
MKYMVFSDIHGNLESLRKVLEEAETIQPDMIISLGDVVGYGADPAKCVELVEEYAHIKISGNHDLAAIGLSSSAGFNKHAQKSIQWTSEILNEKQLNALKDYEPIYHHRDCLFAHSSPLSPLNWEYIYNISQAREIFKQSKEKFIFIGHTHIPGIVSYNKKGDTKTIQKTFININPEKRYLINTGSVGQPRDGINAGCFTVLDTIKGTINQRRVKYDFAPTQEKILAAGLPGILATRLENGK